MDNNKNTLRKAIYTLSQDKELSYVIGTLTEVMSQIQLEDVIKNLIDPLHVDGIENLDDIESLNITKAYTTTGTLEPLTKQNPVIGDVTTNSTVSVE